MDETPKEPEAIPPAASTEPDWGPPNTHYPPPGQEPPAGSVPPGSVPPGYGQQGYPPPGQYPPPGYAPPAGLSTNTAAALCYLTFIPAVVFLVLEPYKRESFIRFHAWQCIVLTLVDMAGDFIFWHHGFFNHFVLGLLHLLLFIFWIISIIKASQGERYHVPIVGNLAESLAAKM
ncbi:MAG: hypothetical protein WBY53_03910 [Acidobacteriaceae bacterium]